MFTWEWLPDIQKWGPTTALKFQKCTLVKCVHFFLMNMMEVVIFQPYFFLIDKFLFYLTMTDLCSGAANMSYVSENYFFYGNSPPH